MQVPGWQRGFPKGGLCTVKEKKKGMLICKRRQDKNQSYTCKKQVSLPDAVRRLYLYLRLQPKRLKPLPPSPKSPRRPSLQLLTALKSELREGWREPSLSQAPDHYHCSTASSLLLPAPLPLSQGMQQLSASTPHTAGAASWWTRHPDPRQPSLVTAPMVWQHRAHNPDWWHARSYISQGIWAPAHKVPPAMGNSTKSCTHACLGFFKHLKKKKEDKSIQ